MHPANRAFTSIRYRAAIWLALCVFALKALVPQGFMPGTDPSATLIQLCSAAGPIWIEGPSKAGHDHHPSRQDAQHAEQSAVCPAGVALAALPLLPTLPGLVPTGTMTLQVAARAPPPLADTSPQGAPLGARAPPVSLG
ncbi:DUF2946 family protein [Bordetella genomosp. 4]|uniref:DUF2946 domain-containing protein n=1 Tax=Bordetella genomosp. 4 TaxID=463044 RepID=A0A261TXF9_9BORD|nr:DUF2946 family protein [Bordetella genomosp. 4]OZI47140.1 DUF2946 domain-containing protein [Bordetella genomosp. 4]OZI54319.1 DUF2946 domain-containing protein [Bordetella genomosp. 4]